MTTETGVPQQAVHDEWRGRRWRLTGGFVVLLATAFGVLALTLGERAAPGEATAGSRVLHGLAVPDWVALLGVAAWFATWLLIIGGPQPWRATRWGWGWLLLAGGPLASLVYLLLGGPLGVGRPRDPNRRLTGGWAFLIGLLFLGGYGASS